MCNARLINSQASSISQDFHHYLRVYSQTYEVTASCKPFSTIGWVKYLMVNQTLKQAVERTTTCCQLSVKCQLSASNGIITTLRSRTIDLCTLSPRRRAVVGGCCWRLVALAWMLHQRALLCGKQHELSALPHLVVCWLCNQVGFSAI